MEEVSWGLGGLQNGFGPEGIIRCFNEKSLKNYKQGNDMI